VIAPARPPIRVLSSQVTRKRGRRGALAINPQTAARLRAYLDRAGNADDVDGPCFGPLKHNGKQREEPPPGGLGCHRLRGSKAETRIVGAILVSNSGDQRTFCCCDKTSPFKPRSNGRILVSESESHRLYYASTNLLMRSCVEAM